MRQYVPKDGMLVESEGYNADVGEFVTRVNGHLGRNELPQAAVTRAATEVGAQVLYWTTDDISLSDVPAYTAGLSETAGVNFNVTDGHPQGGGWLTEPSATTTLTVPAGMLEVRFVAQYWYETSNGLVSPKFVQFRVCLDGAPVLESGRLFDSPANVHLGGAFPVTAGPVTITLQYSIPPMDTGFSTTARVFDFWAGQIVSTMRIR